MYTPAICILVVGTILLILGSILFLRNYKESLKKTSQRKNLYVNSVVLASSIGIVILGTIYVFMINSQLS